MKRFIRLFPWLLILLALILVGCSGGGEAAPDEEPGAAEAGGTGREGVVVITQENVAEGVEMHVGEQAVVMLEDGYDWKINTTPDLVLGEVKGAELLEGEQGLFEAKFTGSATIQAIGKPTCLKDNPPCTEPQKQYLIKVRVRPAAN